MVIGRVSLTTLLACLLAVIAALFAREVVSAHLLTRSVDPGLARDLSYLAVPVILFILLFPVCRQEKGFFAVLYLRRKLTWRVLILSIAIGILLRLSWWSHLIMSVAFGWQRNPDPSAIIGPSFSFSCPPTSTFILGLLVMALLVPFIEEVFHRGIVVSALISRGNYAAILVSAIVFALFHRQFAWGFAFLSGLVFAILYLKTGSLWSSTIAHMTVNAAIQLDWRCLSGQWNPKAETLPLWSIGALASASLLASIVGICWLTKKVLSERSASR